MVCETCSSLPKPKHSSGIRFFWAFQVVLKERNLVCSRPSWCHGANQVSLCTPRTRLTETGFRVGGQGQKGWNRRDRIHVLAFTWYSSDMSSSPQILISLNSSLPTCSIDLWLYLRKRTVASFINEIQSSEYLLPFFLWPGYHRTHLSYNFFQQVSLTFPHLIHEPFCEFNRSLF